MSDMHLLFEIIHRTGESILPMVKTISENGFLNHRVYLWESEATNLDSMPLCYI